MHPDGKPHQDNLTITNATYGKSSSEPLRH
jgi:hypothetical protein